MEKKKMDLDGFVKVVKENQLSRDARHAARHHSAVNVKEADEIREALLRSADAEKKGQA